MIGSMAWLSLAFSKHQQGWLVIHTPAGQMHVLNEHA
jgi:hypothetical protein